jgi:hypothetical protein
MSELCKCGEKAVWFMDPEGDPLPESMCHDCFAIWLSTWEPLKEEEYDG